MFCGNCGSKLEEGAVFCGNCGTSVSSTMAKLSPATVTSTPVGNAPAPIQAAVPIASPSVTATAPASVPREPSAKEMRASDMPSAVAEEAPATVGSPAETVTDPFDPDKTGKLATIRAAEPLPQPEPQVSPVSAPPIQVPPAPSVVPVPVPATPFPDTPPARSSGALPVILVVVVVALLAGAAWYFLRGRTGSPSGNVDVFVTPSQMSVSAGATAVIEASVTGSENSDVTWTVLEGSSGGSVVSTGASAHDGKIYAAAKYSAPQTPGVYHVLATSKANASRASSSTITVHP